jgi:hypothetical protein
LKGGKYLQSITNLVIYLLSSKKKLVYTTFSQKDYYKVASNLKSSSVKYRVDTIANTSSSPGGTYNDLGTEYKFYVKKEDEHKAQQAIHKKK